MPNDGDSESSAIGPKAEVPPTITKGLLMPTTDTNESPRINLDLDDGFILSATDADAILLGQLFIGDVHDSTFCVVAVPRKTLHDMIDAWLDQKAAFYKDNGTFAGTGVVALDKIEPRGTIQISDHLLPLEVTDIDDEAIEPPKLVNVPYFAASVFEVDMELG
jgi:hypothetical protein